MKRERIKQKAKHVHAKGMIIITVNSQINKKIFTFRPHSLITNKNPWESSPQFSFNFLQFIYPQIWNLERSSQNKRQDKWMNNDMRNTFKKADILWEFRPIVWMNKNEKEIE